MNIKNKVDYIFDLNVDELIDTLNNHSNYKLAISLGNLSVDIDKKVLLNKIQNYVNNNLNSRILIDLALYHDDNKILLRDSTWTSLATNISFK